MKGHIRKRGNKYLVFSGYKTKRSSKNVAKKITDLNEGTFVEPSKLTLKDYLVQWLEIKRMSLKRIPTFLIVAT